MKTIFLLLLISLSVFMSCCSKLFPIDKLSLQKMDYNGNELRTDGYYYCYYEETDITSIYFLFRNGIIRDAGSYSRYNENNREQEMVSYYNRFSPITDWGIFIIDSSKIQIEQWIESPSGVYTSTIKRSGYIEDDTTFHIVESYYSETKKTKQIDEVWHFKQLDNKPDSTNVYIK